MSHVRWPLIVVCLFGWGVPAMAQSGTSIADAVVGWPSYGRDAAETHYSPLDRITKANVTDLRMVWSSRLALPPGRLEATPIVVDGVLYVTGGWSAVAALDARTGALLWRWDPAIVRGGASEGGPSICCGPVNRGVAFHGGKIFLGLLDGRLVALDAVTGDIRWVRQTTPRESDYSITQAPRVVGRNVVIGNSGAEFGVRGYVTAYDVDTGVEVWRTYTVPGDPSLGFESTAMEYAASTWTGDWWELGGGGTVWDGMAYDPELNLLYVGVGNGSPWSREHRSPGGGDNLFLSSILALDATTGEMVWYYQTTPGDDWDYTATQNLILADLVIDGAVRNVLMQAPKNGFFYVIDRRTGDLISADPFATVTWALGVDPASGRPTEAPHARYDARGSWVAPGPEGAHGWEPMSWSPRTGLVYIPGRNTARVFRRDGAFVARTGRYNTGVTLLDFGPPGVLGSPLPDSLLPTFLLAWDPVARRENWRVQFASTSLGGTLATGGDLVFSTAAGGRFVAFDAAFGDLLWEHRLVAGVGTPISYELDGEQYIAVPAGSGDSASVWTFGLKER